MGMAEVGRAVPMARYEPGDYIKVEFKDDQSGESEWMWVLVERCDVADRLVFGTLDSLPVVHGDRLRLGQEVAISFENIREHKKHDAFVN
jgi:hypothetical protein